MTHYPSPLFLYSELFHRNTTFMVGKVFLSHLYMHSSHSFGKGGSGGSCLMQLPVNERLHWYTLIKSAQKGNNLYKLR